MAIETIILTVDTNTNVISVQNITNGTQDSVGIDGLEDSIRFVTSERIGDIDSWG